MPPSDDPNIILVSLMDGTLTMVNRNRNHTVVFIVYILVLILVLPCIFFTSTILVPSGLMFFVHNVRRKIMFILSYLYLYLGIVRDKKRHIN